MVSNVHIDIISNLHSLSLMDQGDTNDLIAFEEKLDCLDDAIQSCNSDLTGILDWDCEVVLRFVEAVANVQILERKLNAFQLCGEEGNKHELLHRANIILQSGMMKLEDFMDLLLRCGQVAHSNSTSFRSENGVSDSFSVVSFSEESVQERLEINQSFESDDCVINLIRPDVVSVIKLIATAMFMSSYDIECCQSYTAARKIALDERLSSLSVENLSIEEVSRMEWTALDRKILRWVRVIKNFVRVYLASEKHLCDLIFGDLLNSATMDCFCESAKFSMMQLLSFAEAVAHLTPSVDKLFRVLDVYDTLLDLLPDIESLGFNDSGYSVMTECQEILSRLSDCGRGIILMLKDAIRQDRTVLPSGGNRHPLTRYVMNYVQVIVAYKKPILLIFGCSGDDLDPLSSVMMDDGGSSDTFSLNKYIVSVFSVLESSLSTKSSFYQNPPLGHLFMMNNLSYMVQKVRDDSDLACLVGDVWIKTNIGKYRMHANNYKRASWPQVLSFLEGGPSRAARKSKDRLKDFYNAYEDLYKVQTAWIVYDDRLREDLQLSISTNVVSAYRTFIGHRELEKYVKYKVEDIQEHLSNLFKGSPKTLP